MTNKVALKILEIEKDKLMSEPESNRDWELITALDIVINATKNEPFLTDALNKAHAEIKEMDDRIEFLKQQIRLWQSKEQQGGDCEDEISLERLQEEQSQSEWIPVKTRPLTEEEKEIYPDYTFIYDCRMPEDGEEVLVTTIFGVSTDTYCADDCGCYFENYCDDGEVLAWKHLPEPYKEKDND